MLGKLRLCLLHERKRGEKEVNYLHCLVCEIIKGKNGSELKIDNIRNQLINKKLNQH